MKRLKSLGKFLRQGMRPFPELVHEQSIVKNKGNQTKASDLGNIEKLTIFLYLKGIRIFDQIPDWENRLRVVLDEVPGLATGIDGLVSTRQTVLRSSMVSVHALASSETLQMVRTMTIAI
jgi:hypothetical protein